MAQFVRHYLLALQFFSQVPVTGRLADWVGFSPAMLRASAGHFPGVGWLVGAVVASVTAAMLVVLPQHSLAFLVAAVLGTVASVLMTGAFHEDGLADVADGLGGSMGRERALEIMKDSRVGAFGVLAVVLALLAKVMLLALLAAQGVAALCAAIFCGHVVSRTWPLLTIQCLPHVGDAAVSKSKPLAAQIGLASLLTALLWCAAALMLVIVALHALSSAANPIHWQAWAQWLVAGMLANGLAWAVLTRWFARRLQGFTGDCLGAIQQVGEIGFYLGLALAWRVIAVGGGA